MTASLSFVPGVSPHLSGTAPAVHRPSTAGAKPPGHGTRTQPPVSGAASTVGGCGGRTLAAGDDQPTGGSGLVRRGVMEVVA